MQPVLPRQALALILAAVLGLGLCAGVSSAKVHAHHGHGIAVLNPTSADAGHGLTRADLHGAPPPAANATTVLAASIHTSNIRGGLSAGTSQTPQVRGPPVQAPA